jgi:hypothetical protein
MLAPERAPRQARATSPRGGGTFSSPPPVEIDEDRAARRLGSPSIA